jgi:S-formylglutathione hydrolase FrmB
MALTTGWLPVAIEVVAIAVLLVGIGWRTRRWRTVQVPVAALAGVAVAVIGRLLVKYLGWTEKPASFGTVLWGAMTGFAAAILILGWRGATWWRRVLSTLAVPLCALCGASALNTATGYFPTVEAVWQRLTGTQPAEWIDQSALAAMVQSGERPTTGTFVWVEIPADSSGFQHRTELVYLPPAWFQSNPPPRLPAVMMIGAEFSHPSDWPQSGGAAKTLDSFAALHDGHTPVVVFPDSSGKFNNDTECVNGPRGNAADHLTKDVVPFMVSHFGVSRDPSNWGLVGWSSGGTCSLMTAVMHPELFSAFVDLDGQLGPNAGTQRQTIARLFGGDSDAWAAFDPKTVIVKHGSYGDMSGWLGVSDETPTVYRPAGIGPAPPEATEGWDPYSEHHADNANKLCLLLSAPGVECAVVPYPGSHDFQSASAGFAASLPWLAGKIGTPNVSRIPMPGAN